MKFAFVTCVQLGLECMEEIYRVGGKLDLAITLADELAVRKSGRVYIDAFCHERAIDLLKIQNINEERVVRALAENKIDWLFIIGWSQIAGRDLLRVPSRGVLGIHPTLLPTGRGRAAIPWAILNGLTETGVTLFKLDERVDAGPIVAQERLPLSEDETATNLYRRVGDAHKTLISRIWWDLVNDRVEAAPQDEGKATVWPGRTPEDGRINPSMTVSEVDRLVRATTHPYPGAFWPEGDRVIKIWGGRVGNAQELPSATAIRLAFSDGVYDALNYSLEHIATASEHKGLQVSSKASC